MFLSNTLNNAQPNGGGPLIRRIITAFLGVMTITQASADSADKKDNVLDARIHVAVSTFRNESGALGRLLFAGALGFPDDESKSIGRTRSSISPNGTACCDFINLSPGDYAVVVMHDENKNGALDKNFVGIPAEGYGASNNNLPAMLSPKWQNSHFNIGPGETKNLAIQLRYF